MPKKPSFSQYLVGQASLERPPFFYAYAVMWIHLIIGSGVALFLVDQPLSQIVSSTVVGSLCLGIVAYGLVAREFALLLNAGSYALSMGRLVLGTELSSVLLVAATLIALVSAYSLLAGEYRRYSRDIHHDDKNGGIPPWISITAGIVVVVVCIFGLFLL